MGDANLMLWNVRVSQHVGQVELAERSNVSQAVISGIERGRLTPSADADARRAGDQPAVVRDLQGRHDRQRPVGRCPIFFGDTLIKDSRAGATFSYGLPNPPFGVDWK